jgi:ferredoxin
MLDRSVRTPATRRQANAIGQVVPYEGRCVQCGICSYNCPMGLDVRAYAIALKPVSSAHCLSCGECVRRCPRGNLRMETTAMFDESRMPGA